MSTVSSFSRAEENTEVGTGDCAAPMLQQQQQRKQSQEQTEELRFRGSPLQADLHDGYEQSELSRVAHCENSWCFQDAASTSRDGEMRRGSNSHSNVEVESRHLNKEALSKLENVVAAGDLPLRSELLAEDCIYLKNIPRQERTVSVVSIAPETEVSVDGSPKRFEIDAMPSMIPTNNVRKSLAEASVVSVESVCGSDTADVPAVTDTAVPREKGRNMDISTSRVDAEASTTTPDIAYLDTVAQSSVMIAESLTNDAVVDFPTGNGYRVKDSLMTQTELTLPSEDMQRCSTTDVLSEKSKPRTPRNSGALLNRENLDTLKREIASGQCPLRDGVLTELGVTLLPRTERSQSMVVEVPATASHLDESMPQRDLASSQDCGKTPSRLEDPQNAETWDDGNDQGSILEQTLAKLQKMESDREIIVSELAELRNFVQVRTGDVTSLLKLNDSKQVEFQKKTEYDFSKVITQITELNAQFSVMVNTEVDVLKQKHVEDFQNLKSNFEEKLDNLLLKINDQFSKYDELIDRLLIQQEKLQKQLDHAFQVEAIPTDGEIPDGKKVRFVIDVQIYNECREVLLPMSVNATVGMCKREILRRIRHQGLIDDDIRYSNVVLLQGTYTLFEEDILSDILSPLVQEAEAEGTCVHLKLRVINLRGSNNDNNNNNNKVSQVRENADESREFVATMSKVSSSAPSPSGIPSIQPSIERQTFQYLDTGVLRAVLVDELSQNESLDRRLVFELERMERDSIIQNERIRHIVIAKDALTRTRAALLDRATYSPVDAHRRVARSALAKLDLALGPGATVEELGVASSMAAAALHSITAASGEEERVDVVLEAERLEEQRKQRFLKEIERLSEEVGKKLRIPLGLMKRAESLTQDAQRAIVLAPSMTLKELDELYGSLTDFCAVVRAHN
ncbi:hypothetical protein LSM04_004340 [Trypanosoma melophagium]|uniref:uncharacterized protein n=1 Tax=Trypanosoma melophagium TaxID=715481 RepID=UPI00351A2EF6|nr:hypothetical protein LSM04_004340 [Trypanosoma melophagium]